jgi:hypothetical protein
MDTVKQDLSLAFRRLILVFERLDDDDVAKLIDDSYDIEIKFNRKRGRQDKSATEELDLPNVVAHLTNLPSRKDAQKFLDASFGTRKLLEQIARILDVPIIRQDRVETLRDKIIEATVGARIRSQAIQGTSMQE